MSSITVNVERTINFPTVIGASQEFITLFMDILRTQSIDKIDSIIKFFTEFTQKYNNNPTRYYFKTVDNSIADKTEYELQIYSWEVKHVHNNITLICLLETLHASRNSVQGTSSICVSCVNKQVANQQYNVETNTQSYVNNMPQDVNNFYLAQANAIGLEIVKTKFAI